MSISKALLKAEIKTEKLEDTTYYSMSIAGVSYSLYFCRIYSEWALTSKRASLYRGVPTYKYFKTLKELSLKMKRFNGIDLVINASDVTA